MARRSYLTPNDYSGEMLVSKCLALPSPLWRFFYGSFGELLKEYHWEQFGSASIDELIETFTTAMSEMGDCMEIGTVSAYATEVLPSNVLLCDGSLYSSDDYPKTREKLAIGLQRLGGFVVPDLRGKFVVGSEPSIGFDNLQVGGEERTTLTVAEMPPHAHGYIASVASVSTIVVPDQPSALPSPSVTDMSGGGQSHNNLPPYMALKWGMYAL